MCAHALCHGKEDWQLILQFVLSWAGFKLNSKFKQRFQLARWIPPTLRLCILLIICYEGAKTWNTLIVNVYFLRETAAYHLTSVGMVHPENVSITKSAWIITVIAFISVGFSLFPNHLKGSTPPAVSTPWITFPTQNPREREPANKATWETATRAVD